MVYRIKELVRNAEEKGQDLRLKLENEFKDAMELVKNSIEEGSLSIVQGPPGTGKTTVFESVLKTELDLGNVGEGSVFLYVAPTNELVAQFFTRVYGILSGLGYKKEEIEKMVRVYGSKFDYTDFDALRKPVDENVVLVISTEYQRPRMEFSEIHLLIDEASRSVVHRPFITMAGTLIKKIESGERLDGSINVIGDPLQAITLEERYRRKRMIRLIMEIALKNLLEERGISATNDPVELMNLAYENLKGEYYELLESTFRLPHPTEVPISMGYYGGRLKALFKADERLKDYWTGKRVNTTNPYLRWAFNVVEEAATTSIPVMIVEPKEEYWEVESRTGLIISKERTKIAAALSVALSIATEGETCVTAPYTDQILHTKMYLQRTYGELIREHKLRIKFETVQSMLGSEADNVVAILGKEYYSSPDYKTIYFQEPELLNVQLSRHRRLLFIVGNLRKLYKEAGKGNQEERSSAYKPIAMTAKRILRMADVSPDERIRSGEKRIGDGAIYRKSPF